MIGSRASAVGRCIVVLILLNLCACAGPARSVLSTHQADRIRVTTTSGSIQELDATDWSYADSTVTASLEDGSRTSLRVTEVRIRRSYVRGGFISGFLAGVVYAANAGGAPSPYALLYGFCGGIVGAILGRTLSSWQVMPPDVHPNDSNQQP